MIFLGVVGFFVFLFVSVVLSALAGALAARVSRGLVLWVPLTLLTCVLFQLAYLFVVCLIRAFWFVEKGSAPFWARYWSVVASDWDFPLKAGIAFGIVGWVWCLKRGVDFFPQTRQSA
jgi:hypothetical protein